jgi:uncharacterized RDD family membrane protein YckC
MQIYVAKAGQQTGPFTREQIQTMLQSRMISITDSAWYEGLPAWVPLSQILAAPPAGGGLNLSKGAAAAPERNDAASIYRAPMGDILAPQTEFGGTYAGFWWRFLAYIIDGVILNVINYALGFAVGMLFFSRNPEGAGLAGGLVGIASTWLYYGLMESSSNQGTLGKMACGLKVTDLNGERISFGKASGRFFGMIISGMILLIGYLMCIWTERKQCLHDIMAGTLVIKK